MKPPQSDRICQYFLKRLKTTQPNTNKSNPTKYIAEVFHLLKKPDSGLQHGEDVTRAGGMAGMAPGHGDRGTAPGHLSSSFTGSSASSQGQAGLDSLGPAPPCTMAGLCSELQIPTSTTPPAACAPAELPELLQGACTNLRDPAMGTEGGHGAPARPGPVSLLRDTQGSRGEVAAARNEQLVVPEPWRGAGGRPRSLP